MNDLINRQDAIDGIIKSCFGQANVVQAEAAAIQYIKRIPSAQPEQRWIPCAERLPETGQVVLWRNEYGSVFTSAITYRTDKYYSVGQHRGSIVAWMPLPEPWKGEHDG